MTVDTRASVDWPSVTGLAAMQDEIRKTNLANHLGRMAVERTLAKRNSFFSLRGQLRSLAVGFACAAAVILLFMFALFNELVITPFIRPSDSVQAPAVNQTTGALVDTTPRITIPKISVNIPVVYDVASSEEKQIELGLDKGIVHYPTTVMPGQSGNAAFFGHSSNNIFNPGQYKFAFVLLHELAVGDAFYITYDNRLYSYQVISREVVKPTQVGVLGPVKDQQATATLITCDPPGTSNNRLVVVGKQTDPDPSGNKAAMASSGTSAVPTTAMDGQQKSDATLPGNGPGLLTRLLDRL